MKVKFTKAGVGKLTPRRGKSAEIYFDEGKLSPPGLVIKATSNAARSWFLTFRDPEAPRPLGETKSGKRKDVPKTYLHLGEVSEVDLDKAREAAWEAYRVVKVGKNPRAKLPEWRESETRRSAGLSVRRVNRTGFAGGSIT